MNDPVPSRLSLLRFLERVQERDLARTRRWIADEERREGERQRGRSGPPGRAGVADRTRAQPARRTRVRARRRCWNAGKHSRAISRDQARRALADGVKACPQCQPDTALGMLD
ncbi:DUF6233 domain-containing protein [Streptomyces sp. NRRL S-646]|uniref:DUF6233 domain-containing protein n=1 Tax=Streptomyces sp. NRRL S-646 TaxID=1463917 RepID=UPI002D21CEF3|nr:DUF6233 domain-containing protein [Streptomyces sp. NRRL S-646]